MKKRERVESVGEREGGRGERERDGERERERERERCIDCTNKQRGWGGGVGGSRPETLKFVSKLPRYTSCLASHGGSHNILLYIHV